MRIAGLSHIKLLDTKLLEVTFYLMCLHGLMYQIVIYRELRHLNKFEGATEYVLQDIGTLY